MNIKLITIAISLILAIAVISGCTDTNAGESRGTGSAETESVTDTQSSSESYVTDEAPSEDSDLGDDSETEKEFKKLSYEEYNALSGKEQELYFNQFEDLNSFFEWYNAAKKEYEDKVHSSDIIIGDGGSMDFDDIFGGNG